MVRINLINPGLLTDEHLIAEHNEILMLLGYVKKHPEVKNIPEKYTLGKGHIKFFKNKLLYLYERFLLIQEEIKKRDYKSNIILTLTGFDKALMNDYNPTIDDYKIIIVRIIDRVNTPLKKKNKFHYYKKEISKEEYMQMLQWNIIY